ncbi:MAG: phospho-N-acetylmuramoyl-pentapeptide-transferase [Candidatus Sumerlaeia bacterium]|nr:phospho-N-acetylmuramoyl-pentapeptide-transferase [Candidatus Sumerlaeia bacterium]
MILWLLDLLGLSQSAALGNLAGYITVRAAAALVLTFGLCVLAGPRFIAWLRARKMGQHIRRSEGENAVSLHEMHAGKAGTPTMGGLLMLAALTVSVALVGDWDEPVLWLAYFAALSFGIIGFIDDYRKFTGRNNKGISEREKLAAQAAFGLIFAAGFYYFCGDMVRYRVTEVSGADLLVLPFVKEWAFALGIAYIPFAVLVLAATSNAVNLTDGLDGLAAGVSTVAAMCFALVAYLAGRADMSTYLFIPHVQGAGEVAVILAALVGACLGFLWFNAHPAQVFMGDTGSMMVGGLLGASALLVKHELLLVLVGGIFVLEAGSVILQVGSVKLTGRRVLRMSPLHHHFEKLGVPESKIIVRFWVVSALLALAGLSTLKLR